MLINNTLCIAAWAFLLSGGSLYAQAPTSSATAEDAVGAAAVRQLYTTTLGNEAQLFTGPEYLNFLKKYHTARGHQFFGTEEAKSADILYDGYQYHAVPVWYDIINDQLIIKQATSPLLIKLIGEKISRFTLDGHTFIHLNAELPPESEMPAGFYDLIFDDTFQVLVKRIKNVQERPTTIGIDAKFRERDQIFIKKGNTFYPVSSKSDLLNSLPEKRKELQKYISAHKLSFKTPDREASVLAIAKQARGL
jgi:hypothetical protein